MTGLFEVAGVGEPDLMSRLHDRLVAAAAADGLLDVAYRTVDSPLGPLLLAATDRGLVRIAFSDPSGGGFERVLQQLTARISPRVLHAPSRLDAVARELDEYFGGRRREFGIPVDLRLAGGFHRTVLDRLPSVPFGMVASYTAVAAMAGSGRAVRAVGTACATNPVPIVVPCHRVVRADGALGGYLGGVTAKRTLLDLEGASVR